MAIDKDIELTIQTTRGTDKFTFPMQTKIAEVISAVVKKFGFASGDRFELVLGSNPGQPLQPERTIVSYHLTDGTVLILTATGSGV